MATIGFKEMGLTFGVVVVGSAIWGIVDSWGNPTQTVPRDDVKSDAALPYDTTETVEEESGLNVVVDSNGGGDDGYPDIVGREPTQSDIYSYREYGDDGRLDRDFDCLGMNTDAWPAGREPFDPSKPKVRSAYEALIFFEAHGYLGVPWLVVDANPPEKIEMDNPPPIPNGASICVSVAVE